MTLTYASYLKLEQLAVLDPGTLGTLPLVFDKLQDLRYGENPHQQAAFYRELGATGAGALTGVIDLTTAPEMRAAAACSVRSPAACPNRSLTSLNRSRSRNSTASRRPDCNAAAIS